MRGARLSACHSRGFLLVALATFRHGLESTNAGNAAGKCGRNQCEPKAGGGENAACTASVGTLIMSCRMRHNKPFEIYCTLPTGELSVR